MDFEDGFRPTQGGPLARVASVTSWAESLSALSLEEARKKTKVYQQKASRERGAWMPAPLSANFFDELSAAVSTVGLFSPRAEWDEPAQWRIPARFRTAYPLMNGAQIEFRVPGEVPMQTHATLKVNEPHPTSLHADPELLFVPCLLADLRGARIGRGGGFYDRYLATHPDILTVGVLHSDYVLRELPAAWLHDLDRPVDALWTESFFHDFQLRRIQS